MPREAVTPLADEPDSPAHISSAPPYTLVQATRFERRDYPLCEKAEDAPMPSQAHYPLQIKRRRELLLGGLIWGAFIVFSLVGLWLLGVWVDGDL